MPAYELIVIGSGPGGYPAAIRAAQRGAAVALVEKERLGGVCLNWGCIPTKTLRESACLYGRMLEADQMGLRSPNAGFDYAAMVERKEKTVERLRMGIGQLLKAHGVDVYEGTAAFAGPEQVQVRNDQGMQELAAPHVIVATGSAPVVPRALPRHPLVSTSRAFLDLDQLPGSVIVMGGGVIGCEFACLAARLGVQTTLVEQLDEILVDMDPDVRRVLKKNMEKELGIVMLTGQPLEDVRIDGGAVRAKAGDKTVEAEKLLCAVGRRPCLAGLEAGRAGLHEAEHGGLAVDSRGYTGVASIWAVGDVIANSAQLAHAATAQGVAVAETLFGESEQQWETLTPSCIFTMPEIGSAGLTEQAADAQGREVKTGKFHFSHLGKALAAGTTEGFVKLVACAHTGKLLGAHAIGDHATDLIAEGALAIRGGWTAQELGHAIHAHPTLAEAWMEAAHALESLSVHQPPPRKRPAKASRKA